MESKFATYIPFTTDEMVSYLKDKGVSDKHLKGVSVLPNEIDNYNLLCGTFGDEIQINYFNSDMLKFLTPYKSFDSNFDENIKEILDNLSSYITIDKV